MKTLHLFLLFIACLPSFGQHIPEVMASWQSPKRAAITGYDDEDAVIIFNNEFVEVDLATAGYVTANTWTHTYHRKIRINTLAGMEAFNRVYVPLYEDLMVTSNIMKIEGRTIKKDGTVVNVEPDFIRQTTLPANAPMLAGYHGKVKLFAFSNLEVGDEVEYFYTVSYQTTSSASKKYFHTAGRFEIGEDYPVLLEKHVYYLDKMIHLKTFCFNGNYDLTKAVSSDMPKKDKYELTIKNIAANVNEIYDNDAYSLPLVVYSMYVISDGIETDWDEVLEYFMVPMPDDVEVCDSLSLRDAVNKVKSKATVDDKINAFQDLLSKHYEKKPEGISTLNRSSLSWYWISLYRKLMLDLKIPASLIFVKDQKYGPLEETFPNFMQFDDCLIQYKNDKGEEVYLQINQPFSRKDEIPYMYEGTKALKVIMAKGEKPTFVQLPAGQSQENTREVHYEFKLSLKSGQGSVQCQRNVIDKGGFAYEQRNDFIAEKMDKSLGWFSQVEKSRLHNYFANPQISIIELLNHDDGKLEWKDDFTFENHLAFFSSGTVIRLSDFMESIFYFSPSFRLNRKKDAYFNFPYDKNYTLSIELPAGYQFTENDLMNVNVDNAAASFVSSYQLAAPGKIIIHYKFTLKKAALKKEEWQLFMDVVGRANEFSQMRLLAKTI